MAIMTFMVLSCHLGNHGATMWCGGIRPVMRFQNRPCRGGLPQRAGDAAITAGEGWPLAQACGQDDGVQKAFILPIRCMLRGLEGALQREQPSWVHSVKAHNSTKTATTRNARCWFRSSSSSCARRLRSSSGSREASQRATGVQHGAHTAPPLPGVAASPPYARLPPRHGSGVGSPSS
jgi:hypothetical protein